jgi:mono/diheme cytochrome c family protein
MNDLFKPGAEAPFRPVLRWLAIAASAAFAMWGCGERPAGGGREAHIIRGKQLYETHCAACHGAGLEGQPNWRERLQNGKLPAPPHDATGHTWHHPDALLFGITKHGMQPYAPRGYESDMPAFGDRLSDEDIASILAYIKSMWPEDIRKLQADVTHQRGTGSR